MSDSPAKPTPLPSPEAVARDRLLAEVASLPGLPGVYRWFDAQGNLLAVERACTDPGLNKLECSQPSRVMQLTPQRRVIADKFADGTSLGRLNDLQADGRGGAWFTQGELYHASADGTVTMIADVSAFTNGNVTITASVSDRVGNPAVAANKIVALDNALPTISAAPSITASTGLSNSTLNAGDSVTFTVNFSEAVTVDTTGGSPQLSLNIGGTLVQAAYVGGSTTNALTFSYTVLAGQNDANGISVAANALTLNGSTLKDAAGNPAVLSHIAMGDNAGFKVDTAAPVAPVLALGTGVANGATAAEATVNTASDGVVLVTAEAGATVVVTFTNGSHSVPVTVTGNGSTPVPVHLSSANLATLTDGTISVSAIATDAGGNASNAGLASFTLDTAAPNAPVLTLGTGVSGGATALEATASTGVVSLTAEQGATVRDGLGWRWSFMGPFETIDLNAPDGLADYAHRFGNMYQSIAEEQTSTEPWSETLINKLESARREILPKEQLLERRLWRDRKASVDPCSALNRWVKAGRQRRREII